jgi:hypothetical protein
MLHGTAAIVIAMLVMIRQAERVEARFGKTSEHYRKYFKFHRFSHACISGVTGAQSVLFAKTLVELFTNNLTDHTRVFLADWRTYPIAGAMALTITLQVYWLQCGLARWDALYVVPIFSSFWIFVGVIGGGVFYNEFIGFTAQQVNS